MEVLRIVSSSMNMRRASGDLTLQTHDKRQYKIRQGDVVFYYSQTSHFDSDVYPEPEVSNLFQNIN